MTAVLRLAAGCEVATSGGTRQALMLQPGDEIVIGPGLSRRVRQAARSVLVSEAGQRALWPVAVAAGSLGEGLPATDLLVAPDQVLPVACGLMAGGLGAPARFLIDGQAIRRVAPPGRIDLAEIHLDAPLAAMAADAALPGLVEALAAPRLAQAGPPEGAVDHAGHGWVDGWARDPARPGQPQLLTLEIDGTARALVLADLYREDLATAMPGNGHYGFRAALAPGLSRRDYHHVAIRRAWDRAPVRGGDRLVNRAPPLETALAAVAALPAQARARAFSAALTALGEAARG